MTWGPWADVLAIVIVVFGLLAILGGSEPKRDVWYCECPDPDVDSMGECRFCHRKPAGMMR